ncbi:type II toxin-antitoxin system RelE/ParE family toxin [Sandaracinobacteroides saxicola]|uniref:Type II toxin-antitoxin system RelE/ParE family toxin n=1 Tax=Sandaracinobacteroides saxicola TaxID=2759707 RepID=A0A7G5IKD8_9SPHN|nr:type II toxin-antitoxin system RelE/ParE family toxin [Sandaracinobacteroides saxicola]QMW23830.1 type II toxin-antitoxin system RelE/ParE family toxin [Sandaracinobacteroides saxicola]
MRLAWSNVARQELEEVRRYSTQTWGAPVARRYLEDVRDAAKAAAERPERARPLRDDFRILRVRSHYLILHINPSLRRVTIARILHVAMDIERHLPKD